MAKPRGKANPQNLIPVTMRSKEEARQISANGGRASGVSRRRMKNLQEISNVLLNTQISNEKLRAMMLQYCPDLQEEEMTLGVAMTVARIRDSLQIGAHANAAYTIIRDTAGQRPIDKSEHIIDDISAMKVVSPEVRSILTRLSEQTGQEYIIEEIKECDE